MWMIEVVRLRYFRWHPGAGASPHRFSGIYRSEICIRANRYLHCSRRSTFTKRQAQSKRSTFAEPKNWRGKNFRIWPHPWPRRIVSFTLIGGGHEALADTNVGQWLGRRTMPAFRSSRNTSPKLSSSGCSSENLFNPSYQRELPESLQKAS
ncbi:unnamed protein product [Nesidiocoris tenuis]|uniref:Uncharacterized protein n=1 Tax=Nesidiocoris tenuis TaxID=355587 RepID=A0A6H5H742_9HEMI|nr:unnamed protein product [Nesidiocoris tenuis]